MRKALLANENGAAAAATPGQLLARWPDTCSLISSWLGHVEIAKALLDKGASVSTSDNDGRFIFICDRFVIDIAIQKLTEPFDDPNLPLIASCHLPDALIRTD